MKNRFEIDQIIRIIETYTKKFELPVVSKVAEKTKKDPFQILIGTLLSLRTKDKTTEEACGRLFSLAKTPNEMMRLNEKTIEKAIYPVGFYRKKAKQLIEISKILVEKYNGKVPDGIEELLKIKGIGRKTANLVMNEGFNKPGICVDTHVHRISNRLGIVKTKNPEESEYELMKVIPKKYWIKYNAILVPFGQNICKSVSPLCSVCPVENLCDKVNVQKQR